MLEVASQMASAMDCYEDMFKEITRKLYGEEEDVDFESEGFKSVEHLTAAFGLATRPHLKSETPVIQPSKSSPVSEVSIQENKNKASNPQFIDNYLIKATRISNINTNANHTNSCNKAI